MNLRAKSIFINVMKVGFAAGILYWLYESGKLDFSQLAFFYEHPIALILPALGWIALVLFMGAWRWRMLLTGIGLETTYWRVVQLHWIGLFFNTTMPGAVGGDLIKAVYVIQDHKQFRTKAMLTILLDRILGLMGLFLLGGAAALFDLQSFLGDPALSSLIFLVLGTCVAIGVFFLLAFIRIDPERDVLLKMLRMRLPGMAMVRKIYEALLIYKQRPMVLVKALVLSVILQGYMLATIIFFTYMINEAMPPVLTLASIIPVAMLLTALPLAPAGVGVGHVAFGQLYQFADVANGANVFNAYILMTLALNLTGILAYVLFKGQARPLPDQREAPVNL